MSTGAAPIIPDEFQIYNSYEVDPKWQRKFTAIWASALGLAILLSVPRLLRAIKSRRALVDLSGVREADSATSGYSPVGVQERLRQHPNRRIAGLLSSAYSVLLWTPRGIELSVGQMLVIMGYIVSVLVCIVMKSQLIFNANRAGFLALAQLPVVFLFGTKNSVASLLLGPGRGYEKLNYLHKWAGRGLFLGAVVHGSLWINDHLKYDRPILGEQKETSGVAALGVLCVIVLSSLRVVRRWLYQSFFVIHVLGYVSFFITICYHTPYASPWIFPPLAVYGFDLMLRLLRFRIKDATLVPVDRQMTLIHVHDCDAGWIAGQHVRLRAFVGGRIFESHPLTILNAPAPTSCLKPSSSPPRSLTLGARAVGDWTRALNAHALAERARLERTAPGEKGLAAPEGVPVQVMLDGPYGGCALDLGAYEHVLLVAGGSGATFTLGVLDDLVGRIARLGRAGGERTRRIEFAWCVRSFGSLSWFAPMLDDIARAAARCPSLDLHISVYVTCLCDPEAVPDIPNSLVTIERPSPLGMLRAFLAPPRAAASGGASAGTGASGESVEVPPEKPVGASEGAAIPVLGGGAVQGGVAVCAAGPESLARETANAVARVAMARSTEVGGIDLHTEVYAL